MDSWVGFIIGGGIPFLLGAIFWLVGYLRIKKLNKWDSTMGEVIDNTYVSADRNTRPTFRFTSGNGRIYEVTSNVGQKPSFSIGRQVPVLYDPFNPSRAVIDTLVQSGRFFLILGNIFLGTGMGILFIGWAITSP